MNENKVLPTLVILLALVCLSLLTACDSFTLIQAKAASPEEIVNKPLLTQLNHGDISAFRWNAIAQGYEKIDLPSQPLLTQLNHGEIAAFRWNAIAQGYEKMDLSYPTLLTELAPGDIMAFRWNAMARAYEKMGLIGE